MIVVTIATLKGGQGKTFLSTLLCRELVSNRKRVLAVSLCSQNDINLFLGGKVGDFQLYDAFKSNNIRKSIIKTKISGVDLVPYDIDSSESVDKLLVSITAGETRLRNLLNQVKDAYDFVVLDTGPNLGSATISAIIASDYVISPMFMSWSGVNGYIATNNAINEMKELQLTNCHHLGIVRTCSNVNRDTEVFDVEKFLTDNEYPELGYLPKSSALKTALYERLNYMKVKSHHISQVNELMLNILNQISHVTA
jgi:chromosome partitioning protein